MALKFHVSVLLDEFEARYEEAVRAGFHPEIRMTDAAHMNSISDERLRRMRAILEERSLSVFTHGPYLGLDIASLDDHIASYSRECLLRGLEVTSALGGRLMVMHTGYVPFFSREGLRRWTANWTARMPAVVDRASLVGVTIALENTWEQIPASLGRLVECLPRGAVRVCLDTGHLNAFSRASAASWWEALGPLAAALHLHDNDGLADDHAPAGRGTFDFPAFIELVRDRSAFLMMTHEVDLPSAAEGRRYIERLFESGA